MMMTDFLLDSKVTISPSGCVFPSSMDGCRPELHIVLLVPRKQRVSSEEEEKRKRQEISRKGGGVILPHCLSSFLRLKGMGVGDWMNPTLLIRAHHVLWTLVFAFLVASPAQVSALNCLSSQSSALLEFKLWLSLIHPEAFISWRDDIDCCSWFGVTCNFSTGFVVSLKLSGVTNISSVSGFSPSIFQLRQLYDLDLSYNQFEGPIPSRLGELTRLVHLNLSKAGFSGLIHKSIGDLHQLELLDLSQNSLSGNIPPELVDLTFLSVLNLSFNNLQGPIPQGNQFSTFCAESFTGNPDLQGMQLSFSCADSGEHGARNLARKGKSVFEPLLYIPAELGFIAGFAAVFLPLLTVVRLRNWWLGLVDRFSELLLTKAHSN